MGTPLLTAIVLSREPIDLQIEGLVVINVVSKIENHVMMNKMRRKAIKRVKTDYWFYLDSDDELPPDYLSVLNECMAAEVAVAYTDEIVRMKGQADWYRNPGEYSAEKHAADMYMLHHLVLYETQATLEELPNIPEGGIAMFEMMLSYQLAKLSVKYIPRVGYIWHKSNTGFHTKYDSLRAVCGAATWCNKTAGQT